MRGLKKLGGETSDLDHRPVTDGFLKNSLTKRGQWFQTGGKNSRKCRKKSSLRREETTKKKKELRKKSKGVLPLLKKKSRKTANKRQSSGQSW